MLPDLLKLSEEESELFARAFGCFSRGLAWRLLLRPPRDNARRALPAHDDVLFPQDCERALHCGTGRTEPLPSFAMDGSASPTG